MVVAKEVVRRLYHDFVLRRSTVQIVNSSASIECLAAPIFIVGVYRSGTTLMRYIIDSHSNICCPPESHFLQWLEPMVGNKEALNGLASMGFDSQHVIKQVRTLTDYFYNNYAKAKGKGRWADKTPEYIKILPFIRVLYPEALFLVIYRNALDQAHSYTRGGTFVRQQLKPFCFPGEDLRIGATRYWVEMTEKVRSFERDNPDHCHRILYEQFCRKPEDSIREVFDFIGEPFEHQTLRFYEKEHDLGREDGRVIATREIAVSGGHYRQWPAALVRSCLAIAGPTLSSLGYDLDKLDTA